MNENFPDKSKPEIISTVPWTTESKTPKDNPDQYVPGQPLDPSKVPGHPLNHFSNVGEAFVAYQNEHNNLQDNNVEPLSTNENPIESDSNSQGIITSVPGITEEKR